MSLLTLGLSHHTAPLRLRERVCISPDHTQTALKGLMAMPGVQQAAILSTCNRTEVYLSHGSENTPDARQWFHDWHRIDPGTLNGHCYQYEDADAVRHILRVASGLDSMVVGEPQVLGQLKAAYRVARKAGTLGGELERLLQYSFSAAKRIRHRTALGANPVSVAYAAVRLAGKIFDDLSKRSVLLIGAGETIELVARHLQQQGMQRPVIVNRNLERARTLAAKLQGSAVPLTDLERHLLQADIIVACTASPTPILSADALHRAQRLRKRRPIFIADLGVPRDVEPAVSNLDDVFLYTLDDLQQVIEQNMEHRHEAAREAELLVTVETEHFMDWLRARRAVPSIRAYRNLAERQREQALSEARAMLARGHAPEEALNFLAHALTRRLTHLPSVKLRTAALEGDPILGEAERLLGIEPDDNSS